MLRDLAYMHGLKWSRRRITSLVCRVNDLRHFDALLGRHQKGIELTALLLQVVLVGESQLALRPAYGILLQVHFIHVVIPARSVTICLLGNRAAQLYLLVHLRGR